MSTTETNRILKRPEVEKMTSLSRTSIYRMMQTGDFPKPIQLGSSRSVGWRIGDVTAWLNECAQKAGLPTSSDMK